MPLKLKKSAEFGVNKRMPLLPDDEYLPGKIVDLEVNEVDTKFGRKKQARFIIELKGHVDPHSENGKEPRRVSIKCNLPEKGRGVSEKSNLYKLVTTVCGGDPWEDNEEFDVEDIVKKKMPIRVMMTTSEAQEQTIINDEGEEETVDDYQYQYVTSYRGPKAEEAAAAKKAVGKPAKPAKGKPEPEPDEDEDEESEDEDEDEDEDEEDEEADSDESDEPAPKKKVKDAKASKSKDKAKAEEEEAEAEEDEDEDEEGEDLSLSPKLLKPLVAGLKKKASNEAGKTKVKDVMKKLGIKAMSDLSTVSEDKARKIAKQLGIELPADDEDDDEKLSFLNG